MNSHRSNISLFLDLFSVLWLQRDPPLARELQGSVVRCVPVEWQTQQDLLVLLQYGEVHSNRILFKKRSHGCENPVSNIGRRGTVSINLHLQ